MTKFHVKRLVRVLIFILSIISYGLADGIVVKDIYPVTINKAFLSNTNYDKEMYLECKNWVLEKKDVIDILLYSDFYEDVNPYNLYPQTSCYINGNVIINDVLFEFSIEGGGITTLINPTSKEEIYFGCNKKICNNYILLLTNFTR